MANGFTIVTNRDNTFFTNNKMTVGSGIPASGSYKIGDIVISDSQANGVFGWVCTQAGDPGRWEVIGSGAGGGNSVLVEYSNVVEITDARTSINIGIPEYNKETDSLEVHYNGLLLAQDVHYSINEAGTAINNLNGKWNENADDTQAMIFVVRKSTTGLNVMPMRNVVDINSATMEVDPGIQIYPSSDIVSVHLNGVLLMEGIDYTIENGKIVKVEQDEAWNPHNVVGQKMFIDVLRNKIVLNEPNIGSISKEHLTSKLAGEIDNNTNSINSLTEIANSHTNLIDNLTTQIENVDFSEVEAKIGDLPTLQTNAKDSLVAAVNELFQNANNGKELIATAIGEPLNSSDTFSAMSNGIDGLTSNFKSALMNNGVSVTSTDKFKQLIEKIASLADSEGKGIQYAEGNVNLNLVISDNFDNYIVFDTEFKPTVGFIEILGFTADQNIVSYSTGLLGSNLNTSEETEIQTAFSVGTILDNYTSKFFSYMNITDNGLRLYHRLYKTGGNLSKPVAQLKWYAIGVGEEDTTLRDSLASILQDEGVEVTNENTMADLIVKVDEEFENKNNLKYLMSNSGLKSFRASGTSWTEVSFNHSFNSIPKLLLIGIGGYGHTLTNKNNMGENNYIQDNNDIYIYISSITADTVTLKLKYKNASGSTSTSYNFYYIMVG